MDIKRHIQTNYTKSNTSDLYIPSHMSVDTPKECAKASSHKEQTSNKKKILFEIAHIAFSTVIAIIGMSITYFSYNITKEQTDISKESLKIAKQSQNLAIAAERPYVGIRNINSKQFAPNKEIIVEFVIQNAGRTPAYQVAIKSRPNISTQKFDGKPDYEEKDRRKINLPPDISHPHVSTTKKAITQAQYDSLMAGKTFFYIYGIIEYENDLVGKRFTEFHREYDRELGQFRFGDIYNNAN